MKKMSTTEIVNILFEKMVAMNPAFKQSWPTDKELQNTKKEWIEAFKDVNLHNLSLIKKGLKKLRLSTSPFAPSVGEFIKMCKPEPKDANAPKLDRAYKEACFYSNPSNGPAKWSHPAVKSAWQRTGAWTLTHESRERTYPKFEKVYLEAIEAFLDGTLTEPLEDKRSHHHQSEKPFNTKQYQFAKPGVLKQYEHVKSREEAMAICDKLLGKGDSALRKIIEKLSEQTA